MEPDMNEANSLSRLNLTAAFALVAAVSCAGTALAQVRGVRMAPAQQIMPTGADTIVYDEDASMAEPPPMPMNEGMGGDAMPAPIPPELLVQLGPAETATLKALYDALDPPAQDEMRAYYRDLGVDLDMALGLTQAKSMQAQRGQMIAMSMRDGSLDFTRKPEAVLNARARLPRRPRSRRRSRAGSTSTSWRASGRPSRTTSRRARSARASRSTPRSSRR